MTNDKKQSQITALVLDDDIDFLNLMKRILKGYDVQTIAVENKDDFFAKLSEMKPRFCMVDLNYNGLEFGYEIIEKIRREYSKSLPLFVVSSRSGAEAITHALEVGATDYFIKPINKKTLESKLSYYFKGDVLTNSKLNHLAVSTDHKNIHVEFQPQIISIDEFGLKFVSNHVIPKGSMVKFSGELLREITGQDKVLGTIISNALDVATQKHHYYAEFDDLSELSLNNVRTWISNKLQKSN